jgi:starch phosphorylase
MLSLDPTALWSAHQALKRKLVAALRETARLRWSGAPLPGVPADTSDTPRDATNADRALGIAASGVLFDPEVFTIGFARRFATYKRADLIFRDLARLRALVTDARRPVQIVFAGKAHPADSPGKKVLQTVYAFAKDPSLAGRIAFVEDYDMHIASRLVQGVDLWLNLPRVPLEASGTSGMKAALNGVPQLSTLDGWWPEAYNGKNGWAIPVAGSALGAKTPAEQVAFEQATDAADAANLYALLEQEVVPSYYRRDAEGLPPAWLERMKHAIFIAGRFFTTRRMLQQYADEYYAPALRGQAPAGDPPNA